MVCQYWGVTPGIEIALLISSAPPTGIITNTHPMLTRSKTGSNTTKVFQAANSISTSGSHILPKSVKQALQSPKWKEAMLTEYKTLLYHKTWTLMELPKDEKDECGRATWLPGYSVPRIFPWLGYWRSGLRLGATWLLSSLVYGCAWATYELTRGTWLRSYGGHLPDSEQSFAGGVIVGHWEGHLKGDSDAQRQQSI
ncbi:hypothetical protein PIB30_071979 [Stylosanthes scabra]|uniref:Uncharacterized protein n=1 Tax=Stylosanthes scabra TaxID=79078 RepID=A0ABU6UPZ9_9FABA|nr:hypothetical protein [Stylosanthes scabra]